MSSSSAARPAPEGPGAVSGAPNPVGRVNRPARSSARSPRTRSPTSTHPACGVQRGDRDQRAVPVWEAEAEHQDYLQRYPNGYACHFPRPGWKLPHRETAAQRGARRWSASRPRRGLPARRRSRWPERASCCRPSPLAQSIRPPPTRRTRVVRCRPRGPHPDATWSAATRSSRGLRPASERSGCEQCDLKPEVDAAIGHPRTSVPKSGEENAICDYRALDTQAPERTEFQGLRRC